VIDENETILNPIIEVLLQYDDIEFATYMSDHPEAKNRKLYIRVKRGKPEEFLMKVIKQLENEAKKFITYFEVKTKK